MNIFKIGSCCKDGDGIERGIIREGYGMIGNRKRGSEGNVFGGF